VVLGLAVDFDRLLSMQDKGRAKYDIYAAGQVSAIAIQAKGRRTADLNILRGENPDFIGWRCFTAMLVRTVPNAHIVINLSIPGQEARLATVFGMYLEIPCN
jgi:hypothetical protein